ncbi:sialate O-acetylesterase [Sinomicrobium sp. 2019215]|nr:sialate O-acetylesterase [Sinomicrobium weinanense]
MILQRNSRIVIWGWASAGEQVRVTFNGKQYKTIATPAGNWSLKLPEMKAGGPYTMKISGQNDIRLRDIWIGDVWVCSGQSNMVHQMDIHDVTYADEIATADYPEIRHFKIPARTSLEGPAKDLGGGSWKAAVPGDVRSFSAVAYFFARRIYKKYRVPVGLINASVGGTPVEAWISEEGFREFPEILKTIEKNKDTAYINDLRKRDSNDGVRTDKKTRDKGLTGPRPWFSVDYVPENWRRINIPGYWEDQGAKALDGVVWYRREIDIPPAMAGKEAGLFLGRIVDADKVYINGKTVGHTAYQYPQRRYTVPPGLLKAGENVFVIQVTNNRGKGGFVPDKPYYLFTDRDTVDLKGYWQYKVGEVFVPSRLSGSGKINVQNEPTALYNAMIAPFVKYPVKGVLWYQGESNAGHPENYLDLLSALIRDWRHQFRAPDMPFIYGQLPNFMDVSYLPSESNWAELREAQLKALEVPHTAMTVNIDLGEWNDIHPDNKKDVGERMALAVRKIAYGDDIVYSGPLYESHKIEGNKIVISFSHTGSGLITNDGGKLSEFAIAGEDKKFVWANARIEGNRVVVWSEEVPDPKYVRYAWADNPDNPNLYNKEGLPASPFRIGKN